MILVVFVLHYSDYLWRYGLWWHPFLLIVPGLCSMIGHICSFLEKSKMFYGKIKMFKLLGECTFEIYLIHILGFEVVAKITSIQGSEWWIVILLCIGIGVFYKWLIDKIMKTEIKLLRRRVNR